MSVQELVDKYGNEEKAAEAVARGDLGPLDGSSQPAQLDAGDYSSWGSSFQNLVNFYAAKQK